MLKIFVELKPFFEDVYREISVREYAREIKVSPPTASKLLVNYAKEGILLLEKKGIYLYYRANREILLYQLLSRLYWHSVLYSLTEKLHSEISYSNIVLFGSLSKAENTIDSDIDLFFNIEKRNIDVSTIEKRLQRKIELHFIGELKNNYLETSIKEGVKIR